MGSTASSGVPAARHRNFWEKTAPVAVKIKLKRLGKIRAPYYRIVVADARTKRDGRAIEEIGKYHPKAEPSFIEVDSDRAQHWLSVGAQPTDPVRKIFEITGDWQKFKGLPGTEGTLQTAAAKEDRKEVFAAAVRETLGESTPGESTAKGRARSGRAERPARKTKSTAAAAKDDAAAETAPAADATADADAAGSG
jgi:small subunit ribosomal protein S16